MDPQDSKWVGWFKQAGGFKMGQLLNQAVTWVCVCVYVIGRFLQL